MEPTLAVTRARRRVFFRAGSIEVCGGRGEGEFTRTREKEGRGSEDGRSRTRGGTRHARSRIFGASQSFLERENVVREGESTRVSPLFLFLFFFIFVVSTPGSRYYADVAGIRVPILSSVSLTSESSASVRSSKGKLQLGDVSPIERTQTNRTRIVIERSNVGGVQHLPSSTIRTLSSSPLFVEEDRPVFVSLYQRIEF